MTGGTGQVCRGSTPRSQCRVFKSISVNMRILLAACGIWHVLLFHTRFDFSTYRYQVPGTWYAGTAAAGCRRCKTAGILRWVQGVKSQYTTVVSAARAVLRCGWSSSGTAPSVALPHHCYTHSSSTCLQLLYTTAAVVLPWRQ